MNNEIIIGGVDEAFNVPWKRVCLRQDENETGIKFTWQDFGGGTGQIMRALNTNEIQVAIVLTEGAVADIYRQNGARIFSSYVTSPLEWGVHTHADSPLQSVGDIQDAVISISKYGSGSHLMPILNAYQQGWDISRLKFKEINNLAGGLEALAQKTADVFFWEKHTTRSYLPAHNLKYIDSFKGPWGAFVVAVNNHLPADVLQALHAFLTQVLEEAAGFTRSHLSAPSITRFNNMDLPTAQSWLQSTRFAAQVGYNEAEIAMVKEILLTAGILSETEHANATFFI